MDTKTTLMLDFSNLNKLSPKRGRILISEPFLEDEYFRRSVILLCEYNEEGAFGFILNNMMKIELSELVDGLEINGFNISLGGPVQTSSLYFIHSSPELLPGSIEIIDGLYMGGEFEALKEQISLGKIASDEIRFFLGYSGWSPNQLDDEMKESAWFVSNVSYEQVMAGNQKSFWNEVLSKMGGKFGMISKFPDNPELN
ncbi:MAG: YqgE/AlgH family protein [Flavobacteriales bacterium]|nr:YqgE/AlgH family protein [Flavobacteriales bacterium]